MTIRFFPPLICTHVAAEILYGLVWARMPIEELNATHELLETFEMLTPTIATASIYARLRAELRRAGKEVPDADYWIAAHAIENRLPLVSLDKHFTFFDGLNLHLLA